MSTRLVEILAGAVLVFGVLAGLALGVDSCHRSTAQSAQEQANTHAGAAGAHQTQAESSDAQVAGLAAQVASQEQAVGRLLAERAALLRRLAAQSAAHSDPVSPASGPAAAVVPDDRDALIAKDAEVIAAQGAQIKALTLEVSVLTLSRDAWKATAEERQRQALAQQAATEAWKKAVTASKWVGRAQGFAAGIGLGYVGGRLK